jgi:hypothetical protein
MIPVPQTKRGGPDAPPEERGDCFDACLASILEVPLESVHVAHDDHWWDHAQAAAARHGYRILSVYTREHSPWEATAGSLADYLGDVYWIAAVPSLNLGFHEDGRPVGHVIVMRGENVAHDPGVGIDGAKARPLGRLPDDEQILEAMVLVPLAEAVAA